MDRTLLTANSGSLWLRFERREGRINRRQLARGLGWMLRYQLGILDMAKITEKALALSVGEGADDLTARCERWYLEMVRPTISAPVVERLRAHQAAGHRTAILTASTQFGAAPLARELDVELISTRLEVREGRLTGQVEPPLCYGEGKLARALAFAESGGASLADAWFYTDSISDLPVLQAVGHQVVVNPDRRLSRHARRAGWPIVRYSH